ncbi:MAG: hypothetical protein ACLQVI_02460 [Polyangiaceae bacterium]
MKTSILALCLTMATSIVGLTPSLAYADDDTTETPPPAPETKNAKPTNAKLVGPEGAAYAFTSVSASPYILLGYFLAKDFTVAGGLGMSINGNGGASSPLTGLKGDSNANVGADLVLAMAYFVVDKFPFAAGPEVVLTGSMAPGNPFDTTIISPMIALRVAPWAAPVAIGTDIGVAIAMVHGMKPTAGLTTNGLDIIFAF